MRCWLMRNQLDVPMTSPTFACISSSVMLFSSDSNPDAIHGPSPNEAQRGVVSGSARLNRTRCEKVALFGGNRAWARGPGRGIPVDPALRRLLDAMVESN